MTDAVSSVGPSQDTSSAKSEGPNASTNASDRSNDAGRRLGTAVQTVGHTVGEAARKAESAVEKRAQEALKLLRGRPQPEKLPLPPPAVSPKPPAPVPAQPAAVRPLYEYQEGIETRWASPENVTGAKGEGAKIDGTNKAHPSLAIPPGQSVTFAEVKGQSGTIRRMWMTIEDRGPEALRGLRVDIYWDGQDKPAVSAPLGDFFGQSLGTMTAYDSELLSSPEGHSFVSKIPMPFRKGMKVVVTNESNKPINNCYYTIEYTVGDKHSDDVGYLHAYWHRENPTTIGKDFEILPKVEGKGRYLGAVFSVIADKKLYGNDWWGEGEVKMYLDRDGQYPTLAGTGTEDYIGTGWGEEKFINQDEGCTIADYDNMRFGFYRFHTTDPVQFKDDLRVNIQHLGSGPKGYFERKDDWASVAFFYLDKPTDNLPPLAPYNERVKGLAVPVKKKK